MTAKLTVLATEFGEGGQGAGNNKKGKHKQGKWLVRETKIKASVCQEIENCKASNLENIDKAIHRQTNLCMG